MPACVRDPTSARLILTGRIQALPHDLRLWITSNRQSQFLKNSTNLVWHSSITTPINWPFDVKQFPEFAFSTSVRDLYVGVTLTLSTIVTNLTRSPYFQHHAYRLHKFGSRIDYCNSLLIGRLRSDSPHPISSQCCSQTYCSPKFSYIFLFHSFIQAISIAPLQVHYYSETLQTQHGYCVGVSRQSTTATASDGLAQGPYVADRAGF